MAPIRETASWNPGWASTSPCKIRTGASSAKHRALLPPQGPRPLMGYGQGRPEKSALEGQFVPQKVQGLEEEISRYLQNHISSALFRIAEKEERLRLESRIIPTVSLCPACRPSGSWLGLHSPKKKIRRSGLWQVNKLGKTPSLPPI